MPQLKFDSTKPHVLHIIVGLDVGGAETALSRLVLHHHTHSDVRHTVVSLTRTGKIGELLRRHGVTVHAIGSNRFTFLPLAPWWLWCLVRCIQREKPDVVQTWIYHANLLGGLAARLCGVTNLIWGIRGTLIPQGRFSHTQIAIAFGALLSKHLPNTIVCCAESARAVHVSIGYVGKKMVVIPNGFDLKTISPPLGSRHKIRQALGVSPDTILIGVVGRFDPLKDYPNFFAAAQMVVGALGSKVRFLVAGRNCTWDNDKFASLVHDARLTRQEVLLLGERDDVPSVLSALDVFCLASKAEGFPNVLCEAMLCGVLVVTTNAGDAAEIVEGVGECVPTRDAEALSRALIRTAMLNHKTRLDREKRSRERIETKYDLGVVTAQWRELYRGNTPTACKQG